jgi:hypothetical protein
MRAVIDKLLGIPSEATGEPDSKDLSKGDAAYMRAMDASDDLLCRIREAERETAAARAVIADVWSQAQNAPFMTTVYEAAQEAKSGPAALRETARHYIPIAFGRMHRQAP